MYGVRRVVLSAAVVLSTIAGVTGCAGSVPAPVQTGVAVESPTPTPTPTAAAVPLPTLPVKCVDILTDAAASEILGFPVALRVNESDVAGMYPAAQRQAGLLTCIWGGINKTDNSWDQSIRLDILPDAVDAYDAGVWQNDDGATPYTAGELSEFLCDGYELCSANLLLEGYWAQVRASFNRGAEASLRESRMATLLDRVAEVVAGAGPPNPAWAAPLGTVTGAFCSDPATSAGAVATAFDDPVVVADEPDGPQDWDVQLAQFVAKVRALHSYCSWSMGKYSVEVVPGATWAVFEMMASEPSISYSLPPLEPVVVAGTEAAMIACSPQGFCVVIVAVGGSAISISGPDVGKSELIEAVAALIPGIVAAG